MFNGLWRVEFLQGEKWRPAWVGKTHSLSYCIEWIETINGIQNALTLRIYNTITGEVIPADILQCG